MGNYKSMEKSLQNSIAVITSSILTHLICNSLTDTLYVVQTVDEQVTLIPFNENHHLKIGFILLTFTIVWIMISIAIPAIFKIINRFRFRKIIRHSPKYLVTQFDLKRKEVLNLEKYFFFDKPNIANTNMVLLNVKELAIIITDIHRSFCPHNKQLKRHMRYNFRNHNHSTIINISNKISDYEFFSLINLLERMVSIALIYTTHNSLLEKDCQEMQKMLNELKTANKG